MSELEDSARTPEEMLREVKVAYRVVEIYGPPDVDAFPYDAELTAQVDAEFDQWLAEVKREAVAEALLKNVTGRRERADACLACGEPLERLDANTICRRCWFQGKDTMMQAERIADGNRDLYLGTIRARWEAMTPRQQDRFTRRYSIIGIAIRHLVDDGIIAAILRGSR